ncbi:hypothetical protein [Microbacterium wangchenii]|uniref:hypothetical protein n=1 Tax=Microbacterium wangchenii TaxID=2541726 RepID=UPI00164EE5AB|nr:hypothetical protein [Microbacterium wangchenii]
MARIDLASQFTDVRSRIATQPTTPTSADTTDGPRYRRLTRKETLLRADQLTSLAALARHRMRQRRVRTERITENTLVRIAIDLLLDNQDLLDGSTEEELADSILRNVARLGERHSSTTPLPRSGSSDKTPTVPDHGGAGLSESESPQLAKGRRS